MKEFELEYEKPLYEILDIYAQDWHIESLDGDEVDRLVNILRNQLNLINGNITRQEYLDWNNKKTIETKEVWALTNWWLDSEGYAQANNIGVYNSKMSALAELENEIETELGNFEDKELVNITREENDNYVYVKLEDTINGTEIHYQLDKKEIE